MIPVFNLVHSYFGSHFFLHTRFKRREAVNFSEARVFKALNVSEIFFFISNFFFQAGEMKGRKCFERVNENRGFQRVPQVGGMAPLICRKP